MATSNPSAFDVNARTEEEILQGRAIHLVTEAGCPPGDKHHVSAITKCALPCLNSMPIEDQEASVRLFLSEARREECHGIQEATEVIGQANLRIRASRRKIEELQRELERLDYTDGTDLEQEQAAMLGERWEKAVKAELKAMDEERAFIRKAMAEIEGRLDGL